MDFLEKFGISAQNSKKVYETFGYNQIIRISSDEIFKTDYYQLHTQVPISTEAF